MIRILLSAALLSLSLHAGVLIKPEAAMQAMFAEECTVTKKTLMLGSAELKAVTEQARMKPPTRLYKLYRAESAMGVCGYGVLVTGKVRSKNAAVLYGITAEGKIAGIEIVAFNEPPEFLPPASWLSQFANASAQSDLRVGKNIPTITGATLSARMITDAARLALAIYAVKVKGQL